MFDLLSDIFSALKVLLIVAVVIGIISALRFVFRFSAKRMPLVIAIAFFGSKTRADAWDLIADMMESGKDDRRSIEAVAESFESDGKFAAAISLRELAKSFAIGKFTERVRKVAPTRR